MRYIICYDIKEDRIRAHVVKFLESFAFRLQFSVFTCQIYSDKELKAVKNELLKLTKKAEAPSLMIIPVCKACEKGMWIHGKPLEESSSCVVV